MSKIIIMPETFGPATATPEEVGDHFAEAINGRVTVQCGNKCITTWAISQDGYLKALGFVGRYQTSNKPWNVSLMIAPGGHQYCVWGRDDRAGRFNKQSGITYEPQTFFKR